MNPIVFIFSPFLIIFISVVTAHLKASNIQVVLIFTAF